jgi:hypothetical protein
MRNMRKCNLLTVSAAKIMGMLPRNSRNVNYVVELHIESPFRMPATLVL